MVGSKISKNALIIGAIGLAVAGGIGSKLYANHVEHTDPEVEVRMMGSPQGGFTCTIIYDKGWDFRYYEVSYDPELDAYREELGDYGDDSAVTLVDSFPSDGLVDKINLHGMYVEDSLMGEYWAISTEYSVDGIPYTVRDLASETMAEWREIFRVEERCLAEDRD